MPLFTISFDIEKPDESLYDNLYVWTHAQGGYHYCLLEDGTWGRLPSTCVVMYYNTNSPKAAALRFMQEVEKQFGRRVTNYIAIPGEPSGYSQTIEVPPYAKDAKLAARTHFIRSLKRAAARIQAQQQRKTPRGS
jgi:hypothetical protein